MTRLALFGALVLASCGQTSRAPDPASPGAPQALQAPQAAVTSPPRVAWDRTPAGSTVEDMLRLINEYRRAAGVPPITLDPQLAKGCREHAEYMVLNRGKPQLYSLNMHHQDPTLPGATPEGAACGKAADLYPSASDLQQAVHGFMATLYHRRAIIAPDLQRVGIGSAPVPGGTLAVALMFVWGKADATAWPLPYPASGQIDVPVDFVREDPNPIPPPIVYAGYPFTLQFPRHDELTNVTATLQDGAGKAVPFFLSTPEHPASEYGTQQGTVCLLPKAPLDTSTRYVATVTATWAGKTSTWTSSFTTMGRTTVDATDEAALLAAIGKPALVRGTIQGAGESTGATAAVWLVSPPRGGRIHQVRADVPLDMLKAMTKRQLHELKGLAIEVEATPKLSFGDLFLPVTAASHLRLGP